MEQLILDAISRCSNMAQAQASVSHLIGKQKFKEKAIELGVWKPGRGQGIVSLTDILDGKFQHYHSSHLRRRLILEGVKEQKCECCGQSTWMGHNIPLTLHHIDGNHNNNKLQNLQILCYNCHAMTENFGSKNKKVF